MFKFLRLIKTVLRKSDQEVDATESMLNLPYRDLSDRFARSIEEAEIDDWHASVREPGTLPENSLAWPEDLREFYKACDGISLFLGYDTSIVEASNVKTGAQYLPNVSFALDKELREQGQKEGTLQVFNYGGSEMLKNLFFDKPGYELPTAVLDSHLVLQRKSHDEYLIYMHHDEEEIKSGNVLDIENCGATVYSSLKQFLASMAHE